MIRELDSRITSEGDVIELVWNDATDSVELHVRPASGAEPQHVAVPRDRALDAFGHPFAYLRS